jgi:N6-adenosine-specific RNA methylase IME4
LQESKPDVAAVVIQKLVEAKTTPAPKPEVSPPAITTPATNAKKTQPKAPAKAKQKAPKPISVKSIVADIKKQDRIDDIEQQAAAIEESLPGIPVGPFHVISIDPPWPYGTGYDPDGRRAANPYPEMSLEQIKAIELPAADDCVLWLWTTHKFMRHSFELLDAWGFRDVAILTWVKDRMGLGSWLRSQSEFCIMAVKGKPPIQLTNQTTIIDGPLREHSRKPDSFYELVNGLCVGAKLDYFSREKRAGWAQVGNTTELFGEVAE